MPHCINCGKYTDQEDKFCENCGKSLSPKITQKLPITNNKDEGYDNSEQKQSIILDLESNISISSIEASELIIKECANIFEGEPLTAEAQYTIQKEMLTFFLLMMERYALSTGNTDARDILQDEIVESTFEVLVTSSFDTSKTEKNFDTKLWKSRTVNTALDYFNEAASDYNSITKLTDDKPDLGGKRTILGRLSVRIATSVGQMFNPTLLVYITAAAVNSLVNSKLKKQVEQACELLQ